MPSPSVGAMAESHSLPRSVPQADVESLKSEPTCLPVAVFTDILDLG